MLVVLFMLLRFVRTLLTTRLVTYRPPTACSCDDEPQEPLAVADSELRQESATQTDTQYVDWQRLRLAFDVPSDVSFDGVYARRIYCPWCKEWTTLIAGRDSIVGQPFPCGCGVVTATYFDPALPWFDEEGRRWTR